MQHGGKLALPQLGTACIYALAASIDPGAANDDGNHVKGLSLHHRAAGGKIRDDGAMIGRDDGVDDVARGVGEKSEQQIP